MKNNQSIAVEQDTITLENIYTLLLIYTELVLLQNSIIGEYQLSNLCTYAELISENNHNTGIYLRKSH